MIKSEMIKRLELKANIVHCSVVNRGAYAYVEELDLSSAKDIGDVIEMFDYYLQEKSREGLLNEMLRKGISLEMYYEVIDDE